MTEPIAEFGSRVRVVFRGPRFKTAYYLGPVPGGYKHRFATLNLRLGRWVGYTAHASHVITVER